MSELILALSIPFGSIVLMGTMIWWFKIRPNRDAESQRPIVIILYTEGISVVCTGPSMPPSLQERQWTCDANAPFTGTV